MMPYITLKKIDAKDQIALSHILLDPQIRLTYMLPKLTEETSLELAKRIISMSNDGSRYVRGIYLEEELVGFLNETDNANNEIELGWVVATAYQSKGICTQAVKIAIEYLFKAGYHTVIAGAFECNPASIRVMEKVGMTRLQRKEIIHYNDVDHNCIFYGICP